MGQTARLLAFNYHPVIFVLTMILLLYQHKNVQVSSSDIIMTADTDLFPIDHRFLDPLGKTKNI